MKTISFDLFALRVGKQAGMTRAAADPLHAAYTKAEPEQQADLRQRWMLNHVAGQIMVTTPDGDAAMKKAASIIAKGKGGGATRAAIAMIDKAYSDFRYNIVRPTGKKPEQAARVKVPAAVRTAAMSFIAEFEGKNRNAQIDAAIAALKAMKV